MYRWEQVKDMPADERMANPFQAGNPCEDPERCRALEEKGGDPRESICPKCQVYTECQVRGYLSQPDTLKHAKAQISPVNRLFFDPQYAETLAQILDPQDETERICILDERHVEIGHLFLDSWLSKDTLKQWSVNWQGRALGNFAKSLLSALEIQGEPNGSAIGRVRSAVEAFQPYEEEIVQQMYHINVRGKMVEHKTVDDENGKVLAHFAIAFEGGASACIPLDTHAENRLRKKGYLVFHSMPLSRIQIWKFQCGSLKQLRWGFWTPRLWRRFRRFRLSVGIQTGRFGINSSVSLRITRAMPMLRCVGTIKNCGSGCHPFSIRVSDASC